MLVLLSPSKTLDETPLLHPVKATQPQFMQETALLHAALKKKSPSQLKKLMGISDKLAELNHGRFQSFNPSLYSHDNAKPALFLFKGDVYDAMPVAQYDAATLAYAQAHLRILSGFYGLLRPLDLIQPYRLEMGTRLRVGKTKDLYGFWGVQLSAAINQTNENLLVNLASEEYFKAVDKKALKLPLLHVQFKERKGGQYKIIGLMAKRARGMMADYILQHRIEDPEGIKNFQAGGYGFNASLSDTGRWVFTRG